MKKILVTGGSGRFAKTLKKIKTNYKILYPEKKVFDITTYGQETTYLTREYPERSREMLKRFSYDVLSNSEVAVVDPWLAKTNLTELFTS